MKNCIFDIRGIISVLIPHKSGLRSDSNPNKKKSLRLERKCTLFLRSTDHCNSLY